MNPFTITEALGKLIGAAGVTKERAESIAAEVAAAFPDLEEARAEFERRIRAELEPSLKPEVVLGLLRGLWEELKSGHPGYNRHHFGGA